MAITDLAATQQGNEVILTFTLPKDAVEGRPLKRSPAVEIYRDFQAAPVSPNAAPAAASPAPPALALLVTIPADMVSHFANKQGVRYPDALTTGDFTAHPNAYAVYSVRTSTSPKKASADSNIVSVAVEPAAAPIDDLKLELTHAGAVLTWTPPQKTLTGSVPAIVDYRIYRTAMSTEMSAETSAKPAGAAGGQPSAGAAPQPGGAPKATPPLALIGDSPAPPFRDLQVQFGKSYVYSVRSVAQYGPLQVESADSNLVTVAARDTFPPAAPQGLVVVLVPAQGASPAYLDLSWSISVENDIAGYNIYRSEQEGAPGQKQNPQLLLTPAFRDMNTVPGRRYLYTVTAVDRAGNESPASAAAPGEVPVPAPTAAPAEAPKPVPEDEQPRP
ncbi:MAG: fibronectin type III domain-containing protein [Candidatus Acidiferrales bacterium]